LPSAGILFQFGMTRYYSLNVQSRQKFQSVKRFCSSNDCQDEKTLTSQSHEVFIRV